MTVQLKIIFKQHVHVLYTQKHVHMTSLPLVHWETWVGLKLFNFPNKNKLNLFQLYIFFKLPQFL